MARGITKEDYITAYNVLNAQINSTSNMKLTKHEKAILHDFLYNAKDGDKEKDMEPFVREHLLGGDNDSTFKEIDRFISIGLYYRGFFLIRKKTMLKKVID